MTVDLFPVLSERNEWNVHKVSLCFTLTPRIAIDPLLRREVILSFSHSNVCLLASHTGSVKMLEVEEYFFFFITHYPVQELNNSEYQSHCLLVRDSIKVGTTPHKLVPPTNL